MKIAFVQFLPASAKTKIPFGILCLATYIKNSGHDPIIFDIKIKRPPPVFFRNIAKQIQKSRPEVIGFTVMCNSLPTVLLVAKECKKLAPHIPIVLGGPGVSFDGKEIIRSFKSVDIVIRGEGEMTLKELLTALEKKSPLNDIPGITFRQKRSIIENPDRPLFPDLDQLPMLDFSLLPKQKSYHEPQIEAGRGCPYRCSFCSTCRMWKQKFRIKSPKRVVDEMKNAYHLFKVPVTIIHDNLLTNPKWNKTFFSFLKDMGLPWSCNSRLNDLDRSLVNKLQKSGCLGIVIGIESGSKKIQKSTNKNLDLEILPDILQALSKHGIEINLTFIIGFPSERITDINQTLILALNTSLHYTLSSMQIYYFAFINGSRLFAKMKNRFRSGKARRNFVSPTLTSLAEEERLINKYPALFPYFYYLKNSRLDQIQLQKMSILFTYLCLFFPATTCLLLNNYNISPYDLNKKMIDSFDREGVVWRSPQNIRGSFLFYYLPFLKAFLKNNVKDPDGEIWSLFKLEIKR